MDAYKPSHKPLYNIGDYVFIRGRSQVYKVSACYRVESWYYYELANQSGYLTREDKLEGDNIET